MNLLQVLAGVGVAVIAGTALFSVLQWASRRRSQPHLRETNLAEDIIELLLRCPGLVLAHADGGVIQGQVLYDPDKGELLVAIHEEPTTEEVVEYRHPLAAPDSIEWLEQKLTEAGFEEYKPRGSEP